MGAEAVEREATARVPAPTPPLPRTGQAVLLPDPRGGCILVVSGPPRIVMEML